MGISSLCLCAPPWPSGGSHFHPVFRSTTTIAFCLAYAVHRSPLIDFRLKYGSNDFFHSKLILSRTIRFRIPVSKQTFILLIEW